MSQDRIDALRQALEFTPDNHLLRQILAETLQAEGLSAAALTEYALLLQANQIDKNQLISVGELARGDTAGRSSHVSCQADRQESRAGGLSHLAGLSGVRCFPPVVGIAPKVKGDAYYQSYICHIPRSIIELALDGHFKSFDGFVFPSICDVIRNLSGIFRQLNIGSFIKYLDFPQNFSKDIGGVFYKQEMEHIIHYLTSITKKEVTAEALNHSIDLYNKNREMIDFIYKIRQDFPWRLNMEDVYYIVRAGTVIPVEEHNKLLAASLLSY